ncbi:hypothetical protein, partial [Bordetella pertussis]|uniref:hypothetical protein n=1 Tax=Bordetella pertussis TaxID=520 RepID=UPI003F653361
MNWGVGDFQFLKSGSDEPCIQPIESSHLAANSLPIVSHQAAGIGQQKSRPEAAGRSASSPLTSRKGQRQLYGVVSVVLSHPIPKFSNRMAGFCHSNHFEATGDQLPRAKILAQLAVPMYSRSGLVILQVLGNVGVQCVINQLNNQFAPPPRCEDSIGCMHGSSEPDLRN